MKTLCRLWVGLWLITSVTSAAPEPASEPIVQPPIQPAEGTRVVTPAPVVPIQAKQLSDLLAWDGEEKEFVAAKGETEAHFTYLLTNISQQTITVMRVTTSCGCTTAHLPPMPWILPPGTNGQIDVTMNLAGKMGIVIKTITVSTDKGTKVLRARVTIIPGAGGNGMVEREQNQRMALADRQAVFRGDCARCHVQGGVGKEGKELYAAVCGICHEAEHRATMVPDLHNLNHETSRELWNVWITYGKTGSLMPAFAQSQGGPLSDDQIRSLVDYLAQTMPGKPAVRAPGK